LSGARLLFGINEALESLATGAGRAANAYLGLL